MLVYFFKVYFYFSDFYLFKQGCSLFKFIESFSILSCKYDFCDWTKSLLEERLDLLLSYTLFRKTFDLDGIVASRRTTHSILLNLDFHVELKKD